MHRARAAAAGVAADAWDSPPPAPSPPRPSLQIARDKLIALGTCIGKFTHTGKFRLTIGCLDVLSQYTKYKVSGTAGKKARKERSPPGDVTLNSVFKPKLTCGAKLKFQHLD